MSTIQTTTQAQPPAKKAAPKATLRDHLESPAFMSQMAKVLPQHLTPTRMARVAVTAMTKTPKLSECDHASFFAALLTLSQIGLEPDGRLAHLIPFTNNKKGIVECQLIVDWKGLAQLAYRSGQVSHMCADVIYSGDDYAYDMGQLTRHVPHFLRQDKAKPALEGELVGAYALAQMKDGSRIACVLSRAELNGIRNRSKSKDSGPWVTDTNEMNKKTAFKRLSKWLPLSSEIFTNALDADDEADGFADMKRAEPAPTSTLESFAKPSAAKLTRVFEDAKADNANPHRDYQGILADVIGSKGFIVAQFVECLVDDGKMEAHAAEELLRDASKRKVDVDIASIPKDVIEHYVGADGQCSEAIRSMDFVIENAKQ